VNAYRECVVNAAELRVLMRDLLVAVGCSEADAVQTTDALLEADLRGYPFEGCRHLPALLRDLRAGQVTAKARPRIVEERSASALVDGDGGPAPVGGSFAVRVAVQKAAQAGCCAVGLVNTDPLYMLGYFGEEMARAGLVGIIASAGRPRVHPPGGVDPILGTNPLTIAVPTDGEVPLIVDFATSGLAFGTVQDAGRRGRRLPEGVAIGPDGCPTRDPAEAVAGALTAFGGYKGFGLALCVGLLAGPLVGGTVGRAMAEAPRPGRRTNRGTLLVAVDPAAFGDPRAFRDAVTVHLREIEQSARAPGVEAIRLPGERSRAERTRRLREGLPVEESVLDELEALAHDLGIGTPRLSRRALPDTVLAHGCDTPN
jgi:LDH2 family malate/lactate/ureidoglycolate dehydrogenase